MIFDLASRRLVLGTRPDVSCGNLYGIPAGREVAFRSKDCPKCKGTGKRGNGRCRECRRYSEYRSDLLPVGQVPDYSSPYDAGPCRGCDGTGEVAETMTDHVDRKILFALIPEIMPVRVYQRDGGLTVGESLFGMLPADSRRLPFALWSSQDYGRSLAEWKANPDGFVATVTARITDESAVQACKIAGESGLVADHIGVLLAADGYTVAAYLAE